jgi:hypothetical protein
MTDQDLAELHRMVSDDPLPSGQPDLASLRAAGTRRLRRRRVGAGTVALAAVAALGLPTYLLAGDDGADGPSGIDPAAPPPMASTDAAGLECGAVLCHGSGTDRRAGTDDLVGEPWVLSRYSDGSEEVVYAARTEGSDLATGDPAMVDVVMIGRRVDGDLYGAAAALQPGSSGQSPGGDPVRFWSNRSKLGDPDSEDYVVLGFVPGAPEQITWSTPDGDSGAVDGTSTSVLEGYTVFYVTPALSEKQREANGDRPDPVERTTDGGKVVELEGSYVGGRETTWPPDLTIHTSDGWSCSLADCGSVG